MNQSLLTFRSSCEQPPRQNATMTLRSCYRRRFLPGQGRIPSNSAKPNSSSSLLRRSIIGDGTSSSSSQSNATVWSHCLRYRASSKRMPPRSQSVNQMSASISAGPSCVAPARALSATDPFGKGTRGEIQALASRRAADRDAYLTIPRSDKTNAQGVGQKVAKREPVAIVDASKRAANSSTATRPILTVSRNGLKSL